MKRVFLCILETFHTVENANSGLNFILLKKTFYIKFRILIAYRMLTWNLKVIHSVFGFPLFHLYSKYVDVPRAGKYLLHQFRAEEAPRKPHQLPPASPE